MSTFNTSIEGSCRGGVSGFVKSGLGCLHRGVMSGIFRVRVNSNKALSLPCSVRCLQHRLHSVVCCVFSSHSFWTSISLLPAGVTQEEGHTGFLIHLLSAVRALISVARRIQPFLSLVDREIGFCVLTIQSFSTRWAFLVLVFSFFSFLVRKILFAGIELTSQRVTRLHGYL